MHLTLTITPKYSPVEIFLNRLTVGLADFAWKIDCRDRDRRAQNGNAKSGVVLFRTNKRDCWNNGRIEDFELFAPTREELDGLITSFKARYSDYQVQVSASIEQQFDGFCVKGSKLEERVRRAA